MIMPLSNEYGFLGLMGPSLRLDEFSDCIPCLIKLKKKGAGRIADVALLLGVHGMRGSTLAIVQPAT